jgi:hypothetical protein
VPPGARWLSDTEELILATLRTDRDTPAADIAAAIDPRSTGATKELRAILANMVGRGLLPRPSPRGYRLGCSLNEAPVTPATPPREVPGPGACRSCEKAARIAAYRTRADREEPLFEEDQ